MFIYVLGRRDENDFGWIVSLLELVPPLSLFAVLNETNGSSIPIHPLIDDRSYKSHRKSFPMIVLYLVWCAGIYFAIW